MTGTSRVISSQPLSVSNASSSIGWQPPPTRAAAESQPATESKPAIESKPATESKPVVGSKSAAEPRPAPRVVAPAAASAEGEWESF